MGRKNEQNFETFISALKKEVFICDMQKETHLFK